MARDTASSRRPSSPRFSNPRAGGIIAMGIEEGDAVMAVQVSDGNSEVFIGTADGMSIRSRGRRTVHGAHRVWCAGHHAARG